MLLVYLYNIYFIYARIPQNKEYYTVRIMRFVLLLYCVRDGREHACSPLKHIPHHCRNDDGCSAAVPLVANTITIYNRSRPLTTSTGSRSLTA